MNRRHLLIAWNRTKRVLKVLLIFVLVGALFAYAMFQGNFVAWFLFYSITTIILLMAIYAFIPLGSFRASRDSGGGALPAGSALETKLTVTRNLRFPFLYIHVMDDMDAGLSKQLSANSARMIFYPSMQRTLAFTYRIPALERGKYEHFGVHLSTSDMFGIIEKRTFIPLTNELLVYPNYYDLDRWDAYEKHDSETTLSLQDFIEDMTSISGAREYVPGDKLTSLDWKASARASKLMTKEFEEYIGQNFLVAWNNYVPNYDYETLVAYEKGIELVTSIIMHAQKHHMHAGLWSFSKVHKEFPISEVSQQQKQIITYLAELRPEDGSASYELKDKEDAIPSGVTFIYVTTVLDDATFDRLKILLSRRVKVLVALIDKGKDIDTWEYKRLKELRGLGADAIYVSNGAINTME
ncbi:DUF58 domain-containing protein [Paenalkalicoccus suaedae]|uniref:DUF58 domain-containing protein n=1 Tax=Paenalkalicoccus suaedae TaxID=2592382 RepID=A0A859FAW2_9BACI|nr:DUF58 domain-containing protein [Paenalkalicoccus suaedae]QKS70399.1 DUF58 domain-containing protein [Paenalkalicoccus suaedae]